MDHQVKVLNKNEKEIVDYFDGIAYRFPPNKYVAVPPDAAKHIFGVDFPSDAEICNTLAFRAVVFSHLQKRWGWNSSDPAKIKAADEYFANLEFVPVTFKLVEKEADGKPILAEARDPKIMRGQKKDKFKPRLDEAEGEEVA